MGFVCMCAIEYCRSLVYRGVYVCIMSASSSYNIMSNVLCVCLSVCVCVCVYHYVCIYVSVCMRLCMYVCVHSTSEFVKLFSSLARIHTHTHTHTYTLYTCAHTFVPGVFVQVCAYQRAWCVLLTHSTVNILIHVRNAPMPTCSIHCTYTL